MLKVGAGLVLFSCALALLCGQPPLTTPDGFAVPQPGHRFEFPRDHGSHPEFKLEWWYLTGHLFAKDGRRFGFQVTFFRQSAPDKSTQLYLAHAALTDVAGERFLHQERLNRAGWDAAAAGDTLDVRNGSWSLRLIQAGRSALARDSEPYRAQARSYTEENSVLELRAGVRAEALLELTLTPAKPLVVFGDDGVSRKGAEPTAASYYLTFSRLRAEGELALGNETLPVRGEAWMDHEISSSQLGANQVGWDWVSVQLNDGRELMLYRLRLRDGGADPASSLTWVDPAGRAQKAPFEWDVLDRWRSPQTGAMYPQRVRLTTTDPATGKRAAFIIEPLLAGQELSGRVGDIAYWEGACRVRAADGREIGSAYMELTGYAKDLKL